ncbi:MAG: hypothetical protein ACK5NK_13190 [Niabella sp.]
MEDIISRKNFIAKTIGFAGTFIGIATFFAGCKSDETKPHNTSDKNSEQPKSLVQPENCNDLTGLSTEEIEKRKNLGYVEQSPSPDMKCEICKLYLPPSKDAKCGSCSLFKGFVDKNASCTYFAPLDT